MNEKKTTQFLKNSEGYVVRTVFSALPAILIVFFFSNCASKIETVHRRSLFSGSNAIIVDHTCTDLSQIPDYWIEKAKELTIHYAHTSHGSQIVSGANFLKGQDSKFGFAAKYTNANHPGLPEDEDSIRMCHTFGNPSSYWESYYQSGGHTRIAADTGLFDFSMFSWCGQQSSNSVDQVNRYMATLDGYEKEYPHMRFIYMTGHTTGGRNLTLRHNNEIIREYCAKNNKVLYDFADIESWTPDGKYDSFADADCDWCPSWCEENPEDCVVLPEKCAHSPNTGGDIRRSYNCVLKGKAFWWMMARLAGWTPGEADAK